MALSDMTALVVSPDRNAADDLRRVLNNAGAAVHVTQTHRAAQHEMQVHPFDVLILDARSTSPFDVLIHMRRSEDLPAIVLVPERGDTAADCFELGADDCMGWPASPRELVARIERRAGKSNAARHAQMNFGPLVIDTGRKVARLDGQAIDLTPKEYDLLVFLARSNGRTFTREQLLHSVWDSSSAFQKRQTVTEHVYRLRRKLESSTSSHNWIVTVKGSGYRFEPISPA